MKDNHAVIYKEYVGKSFVYKVTMTDGKTAGFPLMTHYKTVEAWCKKNGATSVELI